LMEVHLMLALSIYGTKQQKLQLPRFWFQQWLLLLQILLPIQEPGWSDVRRYLTVTVNGIAYSEEIYINNENWV
jgi:hypothetical protein